MKHGFDGNSTRLEVTIGRLRRKLDAPSDVKLLHTVRGAAYVLEDRTERSDQAEIC
ncbi:helix-turn-helix domain-containing protein [Variovorax sp. OK605]|uniref:helix-turn-helix domain-containing protein n=1 Tax=Variovorax sp. OK605 TaxID=1855317 RepID=UPI00210E33EF|nr:helix-turn-helix domain-containing protein [Variovorax sp. OK605]